jgi:uncharacterized protein YdiU (UPF0061 family)
MPVSPDYRPDPQFERLGDTFSDPVAAAAFPKTVLRHRNGGAARSVGLETLSDDEWVQHFGRFVPLPENMPQPRAMRYHGHQFRSYNPDIGDGRGFLFAQLRDDRGRLLDLGTKGTGPTPYSRSGDGRLTLKGGVREVLAAAMLEARGVNTSKAFSLIETGEALQRGDEPSPTRSAVLVRLNHSHIRFGTFQRHAYHKDPEALKALVAHVGAHYLPEAVDAAALVQAATDNSARLCGQWMAAGFIHGVLNTDNMTVTGESFDYGPFRFAPTFDPGFTAAYFDHSGLYAFARQPEAVFWNCRALASTLASIADEDALIAALEAFEPAYRVGLRDAVFARLGIAATDDLDADIDFVRETYALLETTQLAWEPFFYKWFGGAARDAEPGEGEAGWAEALARYQPVRPERLDHAYFQDGPVCDLLYDEIEEIWDAIDQSDDWSVFERKLAQIEAVRVAYL